MLRFLLWRIFQSIVVLWAIYTVTFFLLMLTPGDPFIVGDKRPPETVRKALAEKYGLDYLATGTPFKDLTTGQRFYYTGRAYWRYFTRACVGDLGPSISFENFTVVDIIRSSLPVSITLGAASLLIALWLGVAAGTLGALTKNRLPDLALSVLTLIGVSLPTFVLGSLLIMAFVVLIPIFPSGDWGATAGQHGAGIFFSSVARIVLPALTLALFFLAYIARLSRASTIDVLSADFVRTARAKGLPRSRVIVRHVGANAALPVLSYLGPAAANILVGSFVVEKLFVIPGLGTHFVNGCLEKDIPLVLGEVLVYSALVVFFNLLVDFAYAAVDPRISLY